MLPGDLLDLGLGPVPTAKQLPVSSASQEAETRERVALEAAVWRAEAREKGTEPERRKQRG